MKVMELEMYNIIFMALRKHQILYRGSNIFNCLRKRNLMAAFLFRVFRIYLIADKALVFF